MSESSISRAHSKFLSGSEQKMNLHCDGYIQQHSINPYNWFFSLNEITVLIAIILIKHKVTSINCRDKSCCRMHDLPNEARAVISVFNNAV